MDYCEIAEGFDIKFECPYELKKCDSCPLFGEHKHAVETYMLLPKENKKTDFDSMSKFQIGIVMDLIAGQHSLLETNNNAFAMKAIVSSFEAGIYPPIWALEIVAGVFKKFLNGSSRGLSTLFGCGPGKNLPKEMNNYLRRQNVKGRIDQYYAQGLSGKPNQAENDAVTKVAGEDDAEADTYNSYQKKRSPAEKLNRAFYKSRRKAK